MSNLSNSIANPETIIRNAYALAQVGSNATASGQQMTAYGILLRHETLIAQGTVLPALAALDRHITPNKARTEYLTSLMELFAPERAKLADGKGDDTARNNADRNKHYQLLSRGLQLAVDLTGAGVTSASWKAGHKIGGVPAGCFHVPASALKMAGDIAPAGGGLHNDATLIPLDGKAYRVVRGEKVEMILATVKQVCDVALAKAGKAKPKGKGRDAAPTEATAEPAALSSVLEIANRRMNEVALDMALIQAARFLNHAAEIVGERGLPATPWAELSKDMQAAIQAVEIFAAECRAAKPAE